MDPVLTPITAPPLGSPTLPQLPHPLPLRFASPPGWPLPSPDWEASHQGWVPPSGWTPRPGLDAAPDGWQWWRRDESAWREFALRGARAAWLDAGATLTIAVIGVAGVVLGLHEHTDLVYLFAGLAVFGPLNLARLAGLALTADERALRRLRARSARLGRALDRLAFDDRDPARAAIGFDEFLHERERGAWSSEAVWAQDQRHPRLREIFEQHCRPASSRPCQRLATAALAGVSGGALLITVLTMLAVHVGGSGSR